MFSFYYYIHPSLFIFLLYFYHLIMLSSSFILHLCLCSYSLIIIILILSHLCFHTFHIHFTLVLSSLRFHRVQRVTCLIFMLFNMIFLYTYTAEIIRSNKIIMRTIIEIYIGVFECLLFSLYMILVVGWFIFKGGVCLGRVISMLEIISS